MLLLYPEARGTLAVLMLAIDIEAVKEYLVKAILLEEFLLKDRINWKTFHTLLSTNLSYKTSTKLCN